MNAISEAFEDLSHALRVLLEAHLRAHSGLLMVDRAEAVGNIESAYAGVLNTFHSLYDAVEKEPKVTIDWYGSPELATVLVLRNARHHNHSRKIRTLYSHYVQEAKNLGSLEPYVLVDFPAGEEGGEAFGLYICWHDLSDLFALPAAVTRVRSQLADTIQAYLGAEKFVGYAKDHKLPVSRVFFNVVPLICNAASKVVPLISAFVEPRSTESEAYFSLFKDMPPARMTTPEVQCGAIALMP